jgi:hypothetical protein
LPRRARQANHHTHERRYEQHRTMLIAEQSRHKSLDMLLVYSRRVDRYKSHSGAAFL